MQNTTTAKVSYPLKTELRQLDIVLADLRRKIREDQMRFRTCCADPRASK